jgi:hypothetical protein
MIARNNHYSQENLSSIYSEFFNYLKKDENSLRALFNFSINEGKECRSGLQSLPTFISQQTVLELEKSLVAVTKLLREAPRRFQNYDEQILRKYHNIGKEDFELNYKKSIQEVEKTHGRMDFLFTEEGIKCIEFNAGLACGGWQNFLLLKLYKTNPLINSFCRENNIELSVHNTLAYYLDYNISEALQKITDIENELSLVIWYEPSELLKKNSLRYIYLKALKKITSYKYLKRFNPLTDNSTIDYEKALIDSNILKEKPNLKVNITIADDINEIKIHNEKLYYKGSRVHIIVPFIGFALQKIQKEKFLKKASTIITEFQSNMLLNNKNYFATLSEHENSPIFNEEEQKTIKKFIPWGRTLSPKKTNFKGMEIYLDSFCKENKDLFVLKSIFSYGGYGVYIGKELGQNEWENILSEALKTDQFIVQEYVESLLYDYIDKDCNLSPHRVSWGVFIVGDKFAGGFARPQPERQSSIINVSQGSTISFLFEDETKHKSNIT